MAKEYMSVLEIQPRTDSPQQEAIDYTNAFKDCVQQIAAARTIQSKCFDNYLDYVLIAPRQPSHWSARSEAKSHNHLHFWSGWLPWIKSKIYDNDTSYDEYREKKQRMESEADDIYRQDCVRYNHELAVYDKNRSDLTERFNDYDNELIEDYFKYVLTSDRFSIDYFNEYSINVRGIQYDQNERALMVQYRIPATSEILPLDYFFYDEQYQVIRDRQLSTGIAADYRNDVARRVLLRVAASLFMSDERSMLDTVELYGYLDDLSTDGRLITVIRLVIPKNEIIGKSPDFISTKYDFIEKFQEERSPELYSIDPYQLRELLIRPRSPKQLPKASGKTTDRADNISSRKS